jgi:cytidylate kinase
MNERINQSAKRIDEPGPVITISRECGCSGRFLAEKLTERMNQKMNNPSKNWKWVNKEILNLVSTELKLNLHQVENLLKIEDKSFLDEFVSSFTIKYYAPDTKIKRAIKDVVHHLATDGNIVIVGRGSEAITRDIQRSLHIKLYAPLSWKIDIMRTRENISPEQAEKLILKTDERRAKFVNDFLPKSQDKFDYDISFNCAKFTQDEIIDVIMKIAEVKSLIK